jgi:predicted methyltransferase
MSGGVNATTAGPDPIDLQVASHMTSKSYRRCAATFTAAAILAIGILAGTTAVYAQTAAAPPLTDAHPIAPAASPEINKKFIDPKLDPEEWVARFEGESREVFNARQAILAAVNLKPGSAVADIGAGTGLFTALFAKDVGHEGWVYAVDVSPRFIEFIADRAAKTGLANITPVLCTEHSTNLPPACIDAAYVCDTYHHFEHPADTLASIRRALRPGGRLVIVDFVREPGVSTEWTLGHVRAGQAVVTKEIEVAGFKQLPQPNVPGLHENYLLIFEKTEPTAK